jgi:Tat protein secretion system quality control protein TatD with DNase activity
MYIDTHAHVNFGAFKDDADQVIKNSLNEKTWMINIGTESKTSKRALDYANKYEIVCTRFIFPPWKRKTKNMIL